MYNNICGLLVNKYFANMRYLWVWYKISMLTIKILHFWLNFWLSFEEFHTFIKGNLTIKTIIVATIV